MRKFLTVLILMAAAVPAYATIEVQYNNAGAVKSTNTISASNALFTPENAAQAGVRNRQIKYERAYINSLTKPKEININVNTNNSSETTQTTTSTTGRKFLKGKFLKDKLNNETTN